MLSLQPASRLRARWKAPSRALRATSNILLRPSIRHRLHVASPRHGVRAEVNVARAVGGCRSRHSSVDSRAVAPLGCRRCLASVVATYVPPHHLSAPPGAVRSGSRASRSNSSFKHSIQKMTAIKGGFLLSLYHAENYQYKFLISISFSFCSV